MAETDNNYSFWDAFRSQLSNGLSGLAGWVNPYKTSDTSTTVPIVSDINTTFNNTMNDVLSSGTTINTSSIPNYSVSFKPDTNGNMRLTPTVNTNSNTNGNGLLNNVTSPTNSDTFLGLNNTGWGAVGLGLQGVMGLANAYNAYQQLGLARDQYRFQKRLANRNLANQAKIINNTYDNAAQVAAGMLGNTTPETISRYEALARSKYVDGSPL